MTDSKKSNEMSDGITYTRNLILRGMSAIYLIAFVSFYYQSAGMFVYLEYQQVKLNRNKEPLRA